MSRDVLDDRRAEPEDGPDVGTGRDGQGEFYLFSEVFKRDREREKKKRGGEKTKRKQSILFSFLQSERKKSFFFTYLIPQ